MVGGASGLMKDAPPYMITFGYPPARVYGVNKIGLKRNGVSEKIRDDIKRAFKFLFRSGLNFSQGVERIRDEIEPSVEMEHLIEFFTQTKRGISPPSRKNGMAHTHLSFTEGELRSTIEMARRIGSV